MQKRNSKGQFTSKKSNKKSNRVRFFGPINSLVWNFYNDYILIANENLTEAYLYFPENEKEFQLEAYNVYATPRSLAEKILSQKDFWIEKDFDEVESVFLQDYSVLVPRTWEEVQKIVKEQDRLENYKNSFKDHILEPKKETKKQVKEEKLTLDDIKVGSLYFNLVYQVVERVIDVQGRLVYTSYHKMECNPFSVNSFRKATQEEVDNYLKESEEIKG